MTPSNSQCYKGNCHKLLRIKSCVDKLLFLHNISVLSRSLSHQIIKHFSFAIFLIDTFRTSLFPSTACVFAPFSFYIIFIASIHLLRAYFAVWNLSALFLRIQVNKYVVHRFARSRVSKTLINPIMIRLKQSSRNEISWGRSTRRQTSPFSRRAIVIADNSDNSDFKLNAHVKTCDTLHHYYFISQSFDK